MSTIRRISFGDCDPSNKKEAERHRKQRSSLLESVSQMSDKEIVRASIKKANETTENSAAARVLEKGPSLVYAATSIAYGAMTKGGLSNKAAAAAGTLALFAFMDTVAKPVDDTVGKVMNIGSKDDKDRKEAHPVANALLNVAALAGVTALAVKGADSGLNKLAQKFQPAAKEIGQKITQHAKNIDNSRLGKTTAALGEKAADFSLKHPKIASAAKNVIPLAPVITAIGASVPLHSKVLDEKKQAAFNNIAKLAACREIAGAKLKAEQKTD